MSLTTSRQVLAGHKVSPLARMVGMADEARVDQVQASVAAHADSKVALFIRQLQDLSNRPFPTKRFD